MIFKSLKKRGEKYCKNDSFFSIYEQLRFLVSKIFSTISCYLKQFLTQYVVVWR
jgi:hypothetical protein